MKAILEQLGFEHLPMLSEFVYRLDYIAVGIHTAEQSEEITNYAKFITQPLTKGMFVPCDEDGNVLEEPCYDTDDCYTDLGKDEVSQDTWEKYRKAREKVLFKGWYHCKESSYGNIIVLKESICDGFILRYTPKHGLMLGTTDFKTIEQAINDGVKLKLK